MITPLKPKVGRGERWPTDDEMVAMLRGSVEDWNLWRFQHPEIEEIILNGVDLSGQNLTNANLSNVEFKGANLRGASFGGANMRHADVEGADLRGTTFTGAHTLHCKFLPPEIRLRLISELIESWEYR